MLHLQLTQICLKNPLCNDTILINPLYNISNPVGNIMTKKLARFIFPTNNLISKDWVCDDIPNSKSILNLLNITLDRLTEKLLGKFGRERCRVESSVGEWDL